LKSLCWDPVFLREFDLHPYGERFAVLKLAEEQPGEKRDKVVFIKNFFEELRRVTPAGIDDAFYLFVQRGKPVRLTKS
jgi:hypothetical protein